ncbi:MAG: bacterial Ig-like domain-containing protein [Candidatus Onthomonas sp.]
MRRPIQLWLFVVLIAVSIVFAVTLWGDMSREINHSPEISFDAQEITVSVSDDSSALLQGVVASDLEDGDVTGSLVVESITEFQEDGSREVTYAAFDSAGNVSKASRTLRYSDYHSPEIKLVKELKTVVDTDINLQDCVRVEDVLDGDITNQIRIVESNYSNYVPGEYQITIQVTNSAGDTTEQTFPIQCVSEQERGTPTITLSVYSVCIQTGAEFRAEDYIEGVDGLDETGRALTSADVRISSGVDIQNPGTYQVGYSLQGSGGTGTARLTVIVE